MSASPLTYYPVDADLTIYVRAWCAEEADTLDFWATPEESAALNVHGADVRAILAPRLAVSGVVPDDVIGVQIRDDGDTRIEIFPSPPDPAGLWWNEQRLRVG